MGRDESTSGAAGGTALATSTAGDDDASPLKLFTEQIAQRFIGCYWRQSVPYAACSGDAQLLKRNTGAQAAIVQRVVEVLFCIVRNLRVGSVPPGWESG